jgi:hypothetical protein
MKLPLPENYGAVVGGAKVGDVPEAAPPPLPPRLPTLGPPGEGGGEELRNSRRKFRSSVRLVRRERGVQSDTKRDLFYIYFRARTRYSSL